ncbi:MAG: hypothetical protein HC862_07510 [Scytonema sp. RU_4_4]|nr:hypothetical protein [Scytonema sp. RU_4_4]
MAEATDYDVVLATAFVSLLPIHSYLFENLFENKAAMSSVKKNFPSRCF